MSNDYFAAIILGIVEGVTEFLPVSSTGHLVIVGNVLGFAGERASTFEIFIQLGAILAVLALYYRRFLALFPGKASPATTSSVLDGYNGLLRLAAACFPAMLLGFFFHRTIKENLFFNFPIALAFIVGGIIILLVERKSRADNQTELEKITLWQCLLIGLAQCFSLWPGVSRAGSTIVGGLLVGLSRPAAAEFSFFMALPMMFAAVSYDLYKSLDFLTVTDIPLFALGFIVSFFTALVSIKVLIKFLESHSLSIFGWYRIAAGLIVWYFWPS